MRRWNDIIIAGTGTDVGKTLVTGCLLRALHLRGANATTMKPVQTGATPRQPEATRDIDTHDALAGSTTAQDDPDRTPYSFAAPVSPHLAARLENTEISLATITAAHARLAARHDPVVIELAGGILVPLNLRETQRDLIRALRSPVLLVGQAGVGTINHCLLSIEALRAANIPIVGIVLCETLPAPIATAHQDNPTAIASFGRVEVFGVLPYTPRESHPDLAKCTAIQSIIDRMQARAASESSHP